MTVRLSGPPRRAVGPRPDRRLLARRARAVLRELGHARAELSLLLGDVVISIESAARQARRGRRTLDDECLRLLIHGVLHLLGHDHERDEEARRMRAEERRLWRRVHA